MALTGDDSVNCSEISPFSFVLFKPVQLHSPSLDHHHHIPSLRSLLNDGTARFVVDHRSFAHEVDEALNRALLPLHEQWNLRTASTQGSSVHLSIFSLSAPHLSHDRHADLVVDVLRGEGGVVWRQTTSDVPVSHGRSLHRVHERLDELCWDEN